MKEGWIKSAELPVSGLKYIGFSKACPGQLLCITRKDFLLLDGDTGEMIKTAGEADEVRLEAVCFDLPDKMLDIAGFYGGKTITKTFRNEAVFIDQKEEITRVNFHASNKTVTIFEDTGFLTCTFSFCGNYFALAYENGLCVYRYQR